MSSLRLRITLNKGRRGIALSRLEDLVEELRRFLSSTGDDISLSEPDAELFELPKDFKVVDHRQSDPPAIN